MGENPQEISSATLLDDEVPMCNSGEEDGQMGENPQEISSATLFVKHFCSVGRT